MNAKLKAMALVLVLCLHGRPTKDLIVETDNSPSYVIGRDGAGVRWKGSSCCNHGDPNGDGYITYGANNWEILY